MTSIDLYTSMGFDRMWAERAPADPEAGIPWLLRATTINTMPSRFRREGAFEYTFYQSRVEFIDTDYTVDDYDPRIKILKLINSFSTIWVSLSDPGLRFVEECHHEKHERRALEATEYIPLPPLDLSTSAMPQDIRTRLCDLGTLSQQDLGGDWNFHTTTSIDGSIWLALLRLTNKNDPSIRFSPDYPRPQSITSQCIARYRNEMKTKISLFCMCVHDAAFSVQNILHTENTDFDEMMTRADGYEDVFRDLRNRYWHARDIIRQELTEWKNACISPMHLDRIEYVNGRARVFLALTEWSFAPLDSEMQITVVPFYFAILFKRIFHQEINEDEYTCDTYPDVLFEEQQPVFAWLMKTEERNRHVGWWTREEESGDVWSYSSWGACVRGHPPQHTGGVFYSPPGSGKTVIITALCAQRNIPTLIIVPKRARIKYWARQFKTFAPQVHVLSLERSTTPLDEDASVIISTWTTYRNHPSLDNSGSWPRLIVDCAHKAKSVRDRVSFLKSLRAKYTWLLTNVPNIVPVYRDLLRIPTNRLDDYILSPQFNIKNRLSNVDYAFVEFPISDVHRRLRFLFYENCTNKPKIINKWSRMIETQPQHVPMQYYASEKFPVDWSPVHRNEIRDERVKERLKEPCSICYEEPETHIITACQHVFCKTCMLRQLEVQNNCPICRETIYSCDFMLSAREEEEYLYINKTRTWVRVDTDVLNMLKKYKDDTDMIEEFIQQKEGRCLFLSEYPIRIKNSTMYVDDWDDDTCLRMTFKQVFKKEHDISSADNVICFGTLTSQETTNLTRRLQQLNSNHVSSIHICFY